MLVETFTQIAPNLAASCLMLLGVAALLFPKTMAAFVGIQPVAPVGISEIRSTLGSFLLGLGATCLWLQSADAFTVLGIASLAAAAVRLLSSLADRSVTIKNMGGVVAEAFLGGLFLLSWGWNT
ncbi:DUF4345 family protein [Trichocoleus sp. FACHB-591]|uniref:DUF4345 family protein n=1 Tax=Trichocoleus sp. FACHB-591 TaxID=2692872 RepID=UPI0021033E55|nr:DUF4345 family protein [Trichocoleus sp. FACHB-591]